MHPIEHHAKLITAVLSTPPLVAEESDEVYVERMRRTLSPMDFQEFYADWIKL